MVKNGQITFNIVQAGKLVGISTRKMRHLYFGDNQMTYVRFANQSHMIRSDRGVPHSFLALYQTNYFYINI